MSFKIHLIIIAAIIVMVFTAWKISESARQAPPPAVVVDNSMNSISIVHASWGLNCKDRFPANNSLQEDNVKEEIAAFCNGKQECKIALGANSFKSDPAPQCPDKQLDVDYRCFTYDRMWNVKSSFGALHIKCEAPPAGTGTQ